MIVLFTGIPCSGKTTLAQTVKYRLTFGGLLERMAGRTLVEHLDGDALRNTPFAANAGFSKEDRDRHLANVGFLAHNISRYVPLVLCSFVSPYESGRRLLNPDLTVFVKCSAAKCGERDVKGMWAKARAGTITNFTGFDGPYEEPTNPDVIVDTEHTGIDLCVSTVIAAIQSRYT